MIPAAERVPLDNDPVPITGWRCWFVFPHERLLRPIYKRGLAWRPRQPMEATCPEDTHEPPDVQCRCGIWSTREPGLLQEPHWTVAPPKGVAPLPGVLVVGQVALWGRVIEHERGWRASHAYPLHLYAFTEDATLAAALRDKYLVPVEYGPRAERLRKRLPPPPEATPAQPRTAAPRPAPPQPPQPSPREMIQRLAVEPLPEGPLKARAREAVEVELSSLLGLGYVDRKWLARYVEWRPGALKGLRRWAQRGPELYGDRWRELCWLREAIYPQLVPVIFGALRAAQGDTTAARRLVWILLARRWREARRAYAALLEAEAKARQRKHRFSDKPLAPPTIYQRMRTVLRWQGDLTAALQDLADTPTPSYREWRRLLP